MLRAAASSPASQHSLKSAPRSRPSIKPATKLSPAPVQFDEHVRDRRHQFTHHCHSARLKSSSGRLICHKSSRQVISDRADKRGSVSHRGEHEGLVDRVAAEVECDALRARLPHSQGISLDAPCYAIYYRLSDTDDRNRCLTLFCLFFTRSHCRLSSVEKQMFIFISMFL